MLRNFATDPSRLYFYKVVPPPVICERWLKILPGYTSSKYNPPFINPNVSYSTYVHQLNAWTRTGAPPCMYAMIMVTFTNKNPSHVVASIYQHIHTDPSWEWLMNPKLRGWKISPRLSPWLSSFLSSTVFAENKEPKIYVPRVFCVDKHCQIPGSRLFRFGEIKIIKDKETSEIHQEKLKNWFRGDPVDHLPESFRSFPKYFRKRVSLIVFVVSTHVCPNTPQKKQYKWRPYLEV